MNLIDKNSLFRTIDNVSEAIFFNLEMNSEEKGEIADFIVNQQGKPYTYANTFAPTENDMKQDLVLFTGERIRSGAGKCHMIGEESCRVLRKMNLDSEKINWALQKADKGLKEQIFGSYHNQKYEFGMYCCKSCSCSLWNNLSSGGLDNDIEMLKAGLQYLSQHRDNNGRWNGFPFYYTLFVLNGMDWELSSEELTYAAGSIERRLKRRPAQNKYDMRRNHICEMIINKINMN